MAAVIAGWAAGYIMAILSTFALTYLAVRASGSELVRRWTQGEMNPVLLAVPFSIGTFVVWTMAGTILGAVYEVASLGDEVDALGSPSAPFLIAMVALAAMPLPLLLLFFRRQWWLWCAMSVAFVALFGWFMPLLAERSDL